MRRSPPVTVLTAARRPWLANNAICRPGRRDHGLPIPSPLPGMAAGPRISVPNRQYLAHIRRGRQTFSTSARLRDIYDIANLPNRIVPRYRPTPSSSLLSLHWPQPPRNVLLVPKLHAPEVLESAISFAKHLHSNYPGVNLVFEDQVANIIHEQLPFPIYTTSSCSDVASELPNKVDLVATLGGDGTILRAASLFSLQPSVPPMLSFSMGSLGFLGEWKFEEFKRAWREVYMSGSDVAAEDLVEPHTQAAAIAVTEPLARVDAGTEARDIGWGSVRGKSMGSNRTSKVLLRHRLKVGVYDSEGNNISSQLMPTWTADEPHDHINPSTNPNPNPNLSQPPPLTPPPPPPSSPSSLPSQTNTLTIPSPHFHAINELLIHRGPHPHLAIIDIFINSHFLTSSVADGILLSTPTGSTAYSLSAGGAIVHPLVSSLLITPICPRSLSFRPLVLPLDTKITLRLSEKNRGRELEVSVDGKRRLGARIGMEVRVEGERMGGGDGDGVEVGGVPCVIRVPPRGGSGGTGGGSDEGNGDDDGWVGGLNGLLKFNYPFGDSV